MSQLSGRSWIASYKYSSLWRHDPSIRLARTRTLSLLQDQNNFKLTRNQRYHLRRMASTLSVLATSQKFALPHIPELYDSNFLDVLLPATTDDVDVEMKGDDVAGEEPRNAMMDALLATSHHTYTENEAPAYSSTLEPTLDAFMGLNRWSEYDDISRLLDNAWKKDPALTLRLIWQLRSIHEGKSEKEGFYRAFGWLLKKHPRTAISNLSMLVSPVCPNKKTPAYGFSHGYWKDLLNILALATTNELHCMNATFLHHPRPQYTYPDRSVKKFAEPGAHERHNLEMHDRAVVRRQRVGTERHEILEKRLQDPKYRALYIAVARLFTEQLVSDLNVTWEIEHLPPDADKKTRATLYRKISLAGKWAPSNGASHDRHTNISTAISLLIHHSRAGLRQSFPSSLASLDAVQIATSGVEGVMDHFVVLRSYYQRWVLSRLRKISLVPEPLMVANRWTEIRYNRVSSVCMKNNTEHFYKHDPEGFQQYLIDVESGKKRISGATLLPHEIVGKVVQLSESATQSSSSIKYPKLMEMKKNLAETQLRVLEAQWNSLITRLKESGSLDSAIAVCDVSGSMGSITRSTSSRHVQPILPAISLSLLLARLAKPPFDSGFITFSATPEFVVLDKEQGLYDSLMRMSNASWGMNTNFYAVFVELLLDRAVKNKVPKEEMIKRVFVFSDMQFDAARAMGYGNVNYGDREWKTTYDRVKEAYERVGYDVPQIVFWDLSSYSTMEVTAEREGVAMVNGFSPSMLKVFMGEEGEVDWEVIGKTKEEEDKEREENKFTPENVMKKAVMRESFDGLVVVD